jgi:hypothetical protein
MHPNILPLAKQKVFRPTFFARQGFEDSQNWSDLTAKTGAISPIGISGPAGRNRHPTLPFKQQRTVVAYHAIGRLR